MRTWSVFESYNRWSLVEAKARSYRHFRSSLFLFYYYFFNSLRLEIQINAFSGMGAKSWNEIPSSLRELPKKSFKLRIKNKLLSVLEDEDSFIDIFSESFLS